MAIRQLTLEEIGDESNSQIRSPTDSNSHCPPKKIRIEGRTVIELTCEYCNKKFFRQIHVQKGMLNKDDCFCSMKCRWTHRSINVNCYRCGEEITLIPSQYKRSKTKIFFCSRECYKLPLKDCGWCGNAIERTIRYECKHNFCSDNCYSTWQSFNKMGDKNPNWKGGISIVYRGRNWFMQRRKAKRRDNYTCQDCGKKHETNDSLLHVHHIKPFKFFDDYKEANILENLVSLCHKCHVKAERELNV